MEYNEVLNLAHQYYNDENIEELKKLVQKESIPEVILLLGKLLSKRKETYDEALKVLSSLEETEKENISILYRGRLLIKQNELRKARKLLKKIISTELGNLALYEIGRIREFEGNISGAKACYFKSLALKKDMYTFYNLGKIFYNEANYKEAEKMYKKGLKLKSNDYYIKFELAKTLIKLKKINEAEILLEQLLEIRNDVYVRLELGKIKVEKKLFDEAENLFNSVLSINSKDTYALHELGMLFYSKKEYKKAKECFEKVLENRFNFTSQYYLIKTNRIMGSVNAAKELAEDLLNKIPDSPGTLSELGKIHFRLGDFLVAKNYFERSLKNLYSEKTVIDLAETERFLGNLERSETLLKKCKKPENKHETLFQLAMVNIRRGNMQEALDMLKESVSINDSSLAIIRALIQCYISVGKLNEALEVINKYPYAINDLNKEFLLYLQSKLGVSFDNIDLNNLTYQEKQIFNYDENAAISYMINMQKTYFAEDTKYVDLDCKQVFKEVKGLLSDENKVNKLSFVNTYHVKLESGIEVEVITLPNNDILKIFPLDSNSNEFSDLDFNGKVKEV